jgi:FG-GAP repeat
MWWRGAGVSTIAVIVALVAGGSAQAASGSGDFDGDGRDDLAVGVQGEDVGGYTIAGAVHVIYGGASGLSDRDAIITRETQGIAGVAGDDGFGSTLAVGRFDGDRFDDLALGVPFDDVPNAGGGEVVNAGSIQVIYGGPSGLTGQGDQLLFHGQGGFAGAAEPFSGLAWSLASGDLIGTGHDDLVASTAYAKVDGADNAGYVQVLRGSPAGVSTDGERTFSQASRGIGEKAEATDSFGWTLATGDVGRSGRQDLAIGVRRESVGQVEAAGAVHVLFGSDRGVRGRGSQYLTQDILYGDAEDPDTASESFDGFGSALTMADRGRPKEDLVIGAPGEDVSEESPAPVADSGLVTFARGGDEGVRTGANVGGFFEVTASGTWTPGAQFGTALTAANVGKGGGEDVFAGAPGSDGTSANSGAVAVFYASGEREGLMQGDDGVADFGENGDMFGRVLAAGRFDGTGPADLAIGVPGEDVLPTGAIGVRGGPVPTPDVGAVAMLPGTAEGISTANDQLLVEGSGGLEGAMTSGDLFGIALSSSASGPTYD